MQLGELDGEIFRGSCGEVKRQIGLHLADYAADLLAAQDAAAVGAAFHITGLPADYAADVVAHVFIAYGAGVHAGADDAG